MKSGRTRMDQTEASLGGGGDGDTIPGAGGFQKDAPLGIFFYEFLGQQLLGREVWGKIPQFS